MVVKKNIMKELEKIDRYIYSSLVDLLLKMVPEYKKKIEQSGSKIIMPEEGVYRFMYEFSVCLIEEILENIYSDFVTNAFMYINKVGESHNLELQNILRIGIFEILYTTKELDRNQVCNMLSEKLQKDFNAFSKYYY